MPGTKEIRVKSGVCRTRKITKAMEMVAASKMKKSQERMRATRPYVSKALQIANARPLRLDPGAACLLLTCCSTSTQARWCSCRRQPLVGGHHGSRRRASPLAFSRKGWRLLGARLGDVHRDLQRLGDVRSAWRACRSCDFFIFEAATISMASVIFRVFCTLRIFTANFFGSGIRSCRSSSSPAIAVLSAFSSSAVRVLLVLDRLHLSGVLALQVFAQRLVGGQRP